MNDPLWHPDAGDPALDATVDATVDETVDGHGRGPEQRVPGDAISDDIRDGIHDTLDASDGTPTPIEIARGPEADPAGAVTHEHPGRYALRGTLGEGGIGLVDRYFDRHLRRDVAIKILKPDVAARPDHGRIEARLAAEARITARLGHPGIVPVHELGRRADGSMYYAMKRIEGRTLREALRDADRDARLALLPRYVALGQAVAYAHSRGYVHRDLKPANVMLGAFGETLVLDWGIARRVEQREGDLTVTDPDITLDDEPGLGQTIDGAVLGTPQYMSPEQLTGLRAVDARSDVYALGVILYQLLTGAMPCPHRTVSALMAHVPHAPAPDPRAVEPRTPPELAAVVRRALAVRPEARYPHAGALVDDVLAFEAGRLVTAHRYTRRDRIRRWLRRRRGPLLVGAAVLAVGLAGWFVRGQRETQRRAEAEAARVAGVLTATDELIEAARTARTTGWLEVYPSRLAALKEPAVEDRIIALVGDPERAVRQLAARTLGLMSSRRAVDPLIARLEPDVEPDDAVVVEVIRALCVIGETRAEPAVYAARARYGSTSYVGHNTALAYRLLPPEPPPAQGDADTWVDYGRALVEKLRPEEGIAAYDRALALQPDSMRGLNNRGIALRRLGRLAEATADFDAALRLDPDFLPSLINRGSLRRQLLDPAGSEVDLTRAMALAEQQSRRPLMLASLRLRAWTRWRARDLEGARADLDQVLRQDGDNRQTVAIDGRSWQAAGDPQRALDRMQRAIELDPGFALTYQHRARLHRELGRPAAALADLDQAQLLDPSLEDLDVDRALTLLALGEQDGARRHLDAVTVARPGDGGLRAWRAVLVHGRRGDWGAAAADLDGAVERARPSERVAFELLRRAAWRRAGRTPPPPVTPQGQIALHDRLAAKLAGQPVTGSLHANELGARCVVALTRWLADEGPPTPPPGPPPFDPDPACAMLDALAAGHSPP